LLHFENSTNQNTMEEEEEEEVKWNEIEQDLKIIEK
jgi:hypothetical protein